MKLWHISQTENEEYDTFDSAVVAALDEAAARGTHPSESACADKWSFEFSGDWCSSPDKVTVRYLGEAAPGTEAGVICASFNAG